MKNQPEDVFPPNKARSNPWDKDTEIGVRKVIEEFEQYKGFEKVIEMAIVIYALRKRVIETVDILGSFFNGVPEQ